MWRKEKESRKASFCLHRFLPSLCLMLQAFVLPSCFSKLLSRFCFAVFFSIPVLSVLPFLHPTKPAFSFLRQLEAGDPPRLSSLSVTPTHTHTHTHTHTDRQTDRQTGQDAGRKMERGKRGREEEGRTRIEFADKETREEFSRGKE